MTWLVGLVESTRNLVSRGHPMIWLVGLVVSIRNLGSRGHPMTWIVGLVGSIRNLVSKEVMETAQPVAMISVRKTPSGSSWPSGVCVECVSCSEGMSCYMNWALNGLEKIVAVDAAAAVVDDKLVT